MESPTKKLAFMGLMLAVALTASYLESLLPVFTAVPGIKLGLANGVAMFVLYRNGIRPAVLLSVLRIILSAFLFQGMFAMLYSLAGAVFSLSTIMLCKKTGWLSVVGVSVAGGVMHNAGQILVAALVLENVNLLYYFSVLVVSGVIAGTAVGALTGALLLKMPVLD